MSLSIAKAGLLHLALLFGAQLALMRCLGLSIRSVATELRFVLVLLGLVFVARVFTTPGKPLLEIFGYGISGQGVGSGVRIVAQMLLVALLGLTLVVTTRPTEIKAAVEWFLTPFAGIPRARIGTMLGLLLRLIPLLSAQAGETLDAQRARAVDSRKNPLYRLAWFTIPFLRRSFTAVDRLTMAMEARCYTDNRTAQRLSANRRDWFVLTAALAYAIVVLAN